MSGCHGKIGMLTAALFISACGTDVCGGVMGVNTNSPTLPPNTGSYMTAAQVHTTYPGVDLTEAQHTPNLALPVTITFALGNEMETFQSTFTGLVNGVTPVQLQGPVSVTIFGRTSNTETGTFNTQMTQLDLGSGPIRIRLESEDNTLVNPPPSTGKTTITPIGAGQFHIDSFFDVFTELSLDGGATWAPQNPNAPQTDPSGGTTTGTIVTLQTPEPASVTLVGIGAAMMGAFAWRRRKTRTLLTSRA